ncbi:mechanosensitive ion channel family protein [Anaeromassilibacillus senegalensis]|uniref:mechanosensitive ion channel family protein n=1 Tax=Anaeromassilibacillus senegalensis TaxID=1673717 RepID=UPI0009E55A8B|nr:mechanosensitive ion channel domain-containing protein [Anaeromassilibacillus senegalensis]
MGNASDKLWESFLKWLEESGPGLLGDILSAIIILVLGWWLSKLVVRFMRRAMSRTKAEAGVISFICSLLKATVQIFVCITALARLGVPVASVITALGAASVTIGLALKDNMTNIASGAQIIFTKPFAVGDYLLLDGVEGKVERIEIMFTTLRTFDNKEIVIPNSKVTVSTITNYSAMMTRRLDLSYSIAYDADIAQAKALLRALAEKNPLVEREPEPLIAVGEHQDSSIQMVVRIWCKTDDYYTLYYQMQEDVKLAFDQAGINIPFPQMDVHVNHLS